MLRVEESRDCSRLEAIRDEISGLCDRCPWTTPFQRPEWLIPWSRCFQPRDPWILEVREQARLIGFLPLFLRDLGGARILSIMAVGVSDRLDLIAEPGRGEEAAGAVFSWLGEQRQRWDVCDLDSLALESPLLSCPAPPGWREEVEPRVPCPVLPLPATVAELEEVIPNRQRYNLRQYRRRARRAGLVELEEAGDWRVSRLTEHWEKDPHWKEMLVALARLHRARWGGGSVRWAFHRQLIPGFLARGALGMYGLRLDGRLAAVHYGFYEQGIAYCYLHAFDATLEKLSPGMLLLGGVIEAAVERGARAFDFLRGNEAYKYRWGARDRESRRRQLRLDR